MSLHRVLALARKDAAEIAGHPALLLPPVLLIAFCTLPAFLIAVFTPDWSGEALAAGEIGERARAAAAYWPALASLSPRAQAQALVFQQCLALLLIVPVSGVLTLAAHAIVGEKQARSLEPLLTTPLTSLELIAAKAVSPFVMAMGLHAAGIAVYMALVARWADAGVWRLLVNGPAAVLILGVAPAATLIALQLVVIVSARARDQRSAQQLGALIVLPVAGLFVAQIAGGVVIGTRFLLLSLAVLAAVNAALLPIGARLFARETILIRWR